MTNSIDDLGNNSECLLLTGTNTTENHPVISNALKKGIKSGTKLIIVDPRKIELVEDADSFLQPKPGTDVAWINGMMNVIINENLYDKSYIEERTEAFEEQPVGSGAVQTVTGEVAALVDSYQAEHPNADYETALQAVFAENPGLYERYSEQVRGGK